MSPPVRITDADDPRIAGFRDVRDKDLRGGHRGFMAESALVLERLIERPERLTAVLVSPSRYDELAAKLATLPSTVPVYVAPVDVMTSIAGFHIHRGALALGSRPTADELRPDVAFAALAGRQPLTVLAAQGLTNVDNMGALFRNGAGFGVDGIALDPTCCDPLYRKAIRVAMGHVFVTPWAITGPWPDGLAALGNALDCTIVGVELARVSRPLWGVDLPPRVIFVLGSEHAGLGPEVLEVCDAVAEIPMAAGVPSLNVGVAAATCLYERQRRIAAGQDSARSGVSS